MSKLKKTKTSFLLYNGYLNSIKKYKARFIAKSCSCTTTELSELLTSRLTADVIQYCEKVYERSCKTLFSLLKIQMKYQIDLKLEIPTQPVCLQIFFYSLHYFTS